MEHSEDQQSPAPKKAYGSVLSILMIVFVLVMGAFYVWNKRIHEQAPMYATPDDTLQVQLEASTTP